MTKHFIAAGLLCALAAVALAPAYAEVPPPLKQLESGVPPEEIQCMGDRVLVIRDGGSPACVYAATAERAGWQTAEAGRGSDARDMPAERGMTQHADCMREGGSGTGTVTLYGPPPLAHHEDVVAPMAFEQPLTTLSYPESFELGEPFTINYTWSFFKTFSELHGDEYPPGNPERYPWAWNWYLDNEWEDEDGNTWWQIATGHRDQHPGAIIQIQTDRGVHLLTEGYADGYFDQRRYIQDPILAKRFLIHPYDQEEDNAGSITLRIDEPIYPRSDFRIAHALQIFIGLYGGYPLYVHFDCDRGYIGTEEIRFFDSGSARADLENPYPCLTEEEWDALGYDRQRHLVTYGAFRCGSDWECPDCRSQTDDDHLRNVREWLDRNGVTENIREYLTGTLHLEPELVEEFFRKYPGLAGLFTLPSSFT